MDKKNVVSVSQLNRQAKQLLQSHLSMIWVRGEVSGLSRPASGHWYFTLKDGNAQISCAMFKGRNALLRNIPKDGDEVIIRGNISLYEARGNYQLIAEHIEAEGEGRLRQAFEALKNKLNEEGLFSSDTKQSLPKFPRHIAIVSSATGAALHDMCTVFERRWPLSQLTIFPCLVQGQNAPKEISQAIILANQYTDNNHPLEAIIIGRGGGSLEDLQAFNNEQVARTIFNSALPIVSAVGHEVDFCISDFVADHRAATPSAAAEILSPNQEDIIQTFDHIERKLVRLINEKIDAEKLQVTSLHRSMEHPSDKIKFYQEAFKHHLKQLNQTFQHSLYANSQALNFNRQRLIIQAPDMSDRHSEIKDQFDSLSSALKKLINDYKNNLTTQATLLNTVSPLATLERGYSISIDTNNKIIRSVKNINVGESINIKLKDGDITTIANSINKHSSTNKK